MTTFTCAVQSDMRNVGKSGLVIGSIVFNDGNGKTETQQVTFEALAGEDALTRLNAMTAARQARRVALEIERNIADVTANGSLATPVLVLSTAAANFAALRTAYQTATKVEAIMIGDFLSTLTDAQLQNAFSLTAGQVTTLRTNKLTPAASAAATIRAAAGQ